MASITWALDTLKYFSCQLAWNEICNSYLGIAEFIECFQINFLQNISSSIFRNVILEKQFFSLWSQVQHSFLQSRYLLQNSRTLKRNRLTSDRHLKNGWWSNDSLSVWKSVCDWMCVCVGSVKSSYRDEHLQKEKK